MATEERPARPNRAGRPKGQGQWALGHREPLNKPEQVKKDDEDCLPVALQEAQRLRTIFGLEQRIVPGLSENPADGSPERRLVIYD